MDNFVTVEFGKRLVADPESRPHGEWHLWAYDCAWRIDLADLPLAASEDDETIQKEGIRRLDGREVESIRVNAAGDLNVQFNGGLLLKLFVFYSRCHHKSWLMWLPGGNVVEALAGGDWRLAAANEPPPPETELGHSGCTGSPTDPS
jgi:hypothetical protein